MSDRSSSSSTPERIAERIVEAILAQRLAPGARLGEQPLAQLFGCSRTLIREALARLAARGIVTVSARRGWYVIEPSLDEAREAFHARRAVEVGLIRSLDHVAPQALKALKQHVAREKAALRNKRDAGTRSFLLGDFHVCMAECLGNGLLADMLRDLTARTTLIAMLYQTSHAAEQSCAEHVQIVAALERGRLDEAAQLMEAHIGEVEAGLQRSAPSDPLARLRDALAPVAKTAAAPLAPARRRTRAATQLPDHPDHPTTSSSYLGDLL